MPKKTFGPPLEDVKTEILEDEDAKSESRFFGPQSGVVMTEELDDDALEEVDAGALDADALDADALGAETQMTQAPTLKELHADFDEARGPAGGQRSFAPSGAVLTTKS